MRDPEWFTDVSHTSRWTRYAMKVAVGSIVKSSDFVTESMKVKIFNVEATSQF